ncbi:nop14-like family protein [Hirsutella rhossiliensis]|uniref:Nop14-like family domain-containing protein n=1 Tax=Hirsutella rhossiliensis TaxID=111463 RepID=A0A9P8MZL7_9HYPO|nr:nop14-like family domain-containing protein [Hirsutella rhossiliensis]KAH0963176.1 nop14-like family domain-containing protein [Hirsutella rhossiliensis]
MAGSQLKRLKASLREQGITGPQQSKKQRRKAAQDGQARGEKKLPRGLVLDGIRQQFNPFDLKHAARGPKFEVTTNRPVTGDAARGIRGRPGQAKAAGEEKRRETLLVDMQHRHKVGGITDRRFGENDPTMAPEDKMLERFAREKQRSHKKSSLFDLEDDEPLAGGLTHGGKSLTFEDEELVDDFNEDDLDADYDSDGSVREQQRLKRLRSMAAEADEDQEQEEPERKKTKKEVMEEVIAKSKMHKYERQAAKEDDDDVRAELDKQLPNIQLLLSSSAKNTKRQGNEETLATSIAGADRDAFEKDYDLQVKRLAQDKRAQPADRTKTEEEKAEVESKRLKELEDKRQRRMMGEDVSDSDEDEDDGRRATELGFDDEDDFIIDDDLVASGSDLEPVDSDDESGGDDAAESEDEEEDEFTKGLLNEEEARNPAFKAGASDKSAALQSDDLGLPFTFPCPQTCQEFMSITEPYPSSNLPTIVQRIRALYHPKLDSKNKEKLANFALALVDFVSSPWDSKSPPFPVLESIVRHIHSLAKMFPVEISKRFRHHIGEMGRTLGTIFPTSDHFHQVVTPAMLAMGRYLGQRIPQQPSDYVIGTYLSILSLQYQQMSKRFVPEVINFCLNTLCALSPMAPLSQLGNFPQHEPPPGTRVEHAKAIAPRRLHLADGVAAEHKERQAAAIKVAVLNTCVQVLEAAADLWAGKSAFLETFEQLCDKTEKVETKLVRMLGLAQLSRRPLELHHHRPLAIKTYIPKFEETFDPDKHYDPDRERAELAKLKAEHKKERKGAMRELRKDANFMAREKLRIKKVKDEAYEKKYKRLIAEIQSEEGREANAYERERDARKRARNK